MAKDEMRGGKFDDRLFSSFAVCRIARVMARREPPRSGSSAMAMGWGGVSCVRIGRTLAAAVWMELLSQLVAAMRRTKSIQPRRV
jgi:hypothetical protein